jgi:hypothetical protein
MRIFARNLRGQHEPYPFARTENLAHWLLCKSVTPYGLGSLATVDVGGHHLVHAPGLQSVPAPPLPISCSAAFVAARRATAVLVDEFRSGLPPDLTLRVEPGRMQL